MSSNCTCLSPHSYKVWMPLQTFFTNGVYFMLILFEHDRFLLSISMKLAIALFRKENIQEKFSKILLDTKYLPSPIDPTGKEENVGAERLS